MYNMRAKVYYKPENQDKIVTRLDYWNHMDTYGADIRWEKIDDYYLIEGTAVCFGMLDELKKIPTKVLIEKFVEYKIVKEVKNGR